MNNQDAATRVAAAFAKKAQEHTWEDEIGWRTVSLIDLGAGRSTPTHHGFTSLSYAKKALEAKGWKVPPIGPVLEAIRAEARWPYAKVPPYIAEKNAVGRQIRSFVVELNLMNPDKPDLTLKERYGAFFISPPRKSYPKFNLTMRE